MIATIAVEHCGRLEFAFLVATMIIIRHESSFRLSPALRPGQRNVQLLGATSDRRFTPVHLSRDRGGIFPGHGQSLKNDIFM